VINDALMNLSAVQRSLSPLGTLNTLRDSAMTASYSRLDFMDSFSDMFSASNEAQKAIAAMCSPKLATDLMGINAELAFDHAHLGKSWSPLLNDFPTTIPSFAGVNAIKDFTALKTFAGLEAFENMQGLLSQSVHSAVQEAVASIDRVTGLRDMFALKTPVGLGLLGIIPESFGDLASQQKVLKTSPMLGLDLFKESMGFSPSAINTALESIQQLNMLSDADSLAKTISAMSMTNIFRDSIVAFNQKDVLEQALAHFNLAAHTRRMQEPM
jgi:hypothetical protein